MSNFGIGKVRYKPICSSEEMELEIKIPSANEVVKNMWNKLNDTEKGFINIMIDKNNKQDLEIERLNNIIKEVRELVENGTDFKSIYFKKNEEDLWKVILANEIKEKYLEILDKGE